jgi:hypothetical protein
MVALKFIRIAKLAIVAVSLFGCTADDSSGEPAEGGSGEDAAIDGGESGGSGGSAQGGTSGTGELIERCHEPWVEDSADACLACALQHCCAGQAGLCLSPPTQNREDGESVCYQNFVKECVVGCFEERAVLQPNASSFSLAAQCVSECEGDEADDFDFPRFTSPAGEFVECIVGSTSDGTAGADEDDAGISECEMSGICYDRSPCAAVCFPSWR